MDSTVLDLLERVERLTHDRADGDEQNRLDVDLLRCLDLLVTVCRVQDAQIRELRGAGEPKYTRPARIHVREQRRGEPSSVDLDL